MNPLPFLSRVAVVLLASSPLMAQSPVSPSATLMTPVTDGQQVAPSSSMFDAVCQQTPERVWFRGEALGFVVVPTKLLGFLSDKDTSSDPDDAVAARKSLFKLDNPVGSDRYGFRFTAGMWLDDANIAGVEASYTRLYRGSTTLTFNPNDNSIPVEFSRKIAIPVGIGPFQRVLYVPITVTGAATGNAVFTLGERKYEEAQVTGRLMLYRDPTSRIDGLFGVRRFTFNDTFQIQTNATTLLPAFVPGTTFKSVDDVSSRNSYTGTVLGLDWQYDCGPWSFHARPKASIMYYQTTVDRSATTTVALTNGVINRLPEGVYTTQADIGRYTASGWTVLPELDMQLARTCGENVRILAGSSFLYFPSLARSANQFSLGISPNRVAPGNTADAPSPKSLPVRNPAMLLTFSLGLELRF